jgi:hypothetical protein
MPICLPHGHLRKGPEGRKNAGEKRRGGMLLHVFIGKFALAAMYLRRVEIDGSSYAAAPTQVSTVAAPPAPAAKNLGVKKGGGGRGGGGAQTLPKQVMHNSAALQQER